MNFCHPIHGELLFTGLCGIRRGRISFVFTRVDQVSRFPRLCLEFVLNPDRRRRMQHSLLQIVRAACIWFFLPKASVAPAPSSFSLSVCHKFAASTLLPLLAARCIARHLMNNAFSYIFPKSAGYTLFPLGVQGLRLGLQSTPFDPPPPKRLGSA